MNPGAGRNARLFFALWPDRATQGALGTWARELHAVLGGRRTADVDIHLTLFFLGDLAAEQIPKMQRVENLNCPPFELTIDHVGWWRHNQIAWAAPSHTPSALTSLVQQLGQWLREQGVKIETRPFAPHITLLRQAQSATLPVFTVPIRWLVDEFVLVRSNLHVVDARYQVLKSFPLSRYCPNARSLQVDGSS